MSLSGVPPLLHQLAGRVQQPPSNMASNDEEDDEQMSDCDDLPYIKCEAVYGEDGDDDDDMSALPFVSTEMREDDDCENDKMKFGMKAPEVGAYVKCSVPSCHSYFEVGNPKYEGFSHFKFPEDSNLRRRWIGIIGQKDDWKPEGAMICSNHFAESAFVTLLEHVAETGQLMPKRSLKAGAIPTMNLDIPKNNWSAQRVLQPPNNGVQAAAPAAPVARPTAAPSVLPATPIRSPYCQARTITLTKNGKRRGRPPKNRPPDDYSPSVPHMMATPAMPSPVQSDTTPTSSSPNATSTPVSVTYSTSQANGSTHSLSVSAVSVAQPSSLYAQSQMSPFHLLGMGRRKRGRPRKEVSSLYPGLDAILQSSHQSNQSNESLRRLAEGAAEAAFGWRNANNWRRNNVPMKRRKSEHKSFLPAMVPGQQRQHRVEQLECNIDPINFLQLQHLEGGSGSSPNTERDLSHLKSLVTNVGDLSSKSIGELCRVVESTLERLRKAEATARVQKEIEAVKKVTKDMKSEVDVKLPPSLSIKAVGPKTSNHGASTAEEEPVPALTITIKREGKLVNGDALPLKVEDIKREPLEIKKEPTDVEAKPKDVKPEPKVELDSDNEKEEEEEEEGPAEEEEDLPEAEEEEEEDVAAEGEDQEDDDGEQEDVAAEGEDQEDDDGEQEDIAVEGEDDDGEQEDNDSDTDQTEKETQNGNKSSQHCHSGPDENGKAPSESGSSDSGESETDNS